MNHLDPVNAAIVFASIVFGPALAALIGPYSVIVIASAVGAAWSLRRRASDSPHLDTLCFFLLIIFTAILVTVGIANTVANWLNLTDATFLLSPIALLIGGIGSDWPRILKWGFARWFKHRTGGDTHD